MTEAETETVTVIVIVIETEAVTEAVTEADAGKVWVASDPGVLVLMVTTRKQSRAVLDPDLDPGLCLLLMT